MRRRSDEWLLALRAGARKHLVPREALWRRGIGTAAAAILVSTALIAQNGVVSNASWNDSEWTHAPAVGALDCANPDGAFASRGEGRVLSGSLLGIDLDSLVEARGVTVTNNGSSATPAPLSAQAVAGIEDAYRDPLDAAALSAIELPLTGILELPADNSFGVVGQFGQATDSGVAYGSSGLITDSGGIDLSHQATGDYPNLATLSLSELLNSPALGDLGLGTTLQSIADLDLTIGAVAGSASLDGCLAAWGSEATTAVVRDYLLSSVTTSFTSTTVGDLVSGPSGVSGINGLLNSLETTVNGLAGNQSVLNGIATGVGGLLNTILGGAPSNQSSILKLGSVQIGGLSATINLQPVRSLLTQSFGDSGRVLTVDPSAGRITIDTTALLQKAYPGAYGNQLNALPPNTNLLADPTIVTALTAALGSALTDWLTLIQTKLIEAIDLTKVNVSLSIDVTVQAVLLVLPVWVPVGAIKVTAAGTLAELRANTPGKVTAQLELLGGLAGVVTGLLNGLLAPLLSALLSGLIGGVGGIVGGAIDGALPVVTNLPAQLAPLTAPIVSAVSRLYTGLFLNGVVALTVNAQNDPAAGGPEPADWTGLDPGRYDVAALRIGVLDALGQSNVRLYLGRGSVGPGCSMAEFAGSGCTNY